MEFVHIPLKMNSRTIMKHKRKKNETNNIEINMELLRKFVSLSSEKYIGLTTNNIKIWQPVLTELLHLLCSNNEIGNENILLASSAYISLQWFLYTYNDFESRLNGYFNLQTNLIINFKEVFKIDNVELFKLILCNGFLQLRYNITCSHKIYETIFKTIYPNCIKYTRYTYFAFKILQLWVQTTLKIGLWLENSSELEQKIETVIFSNWDNKICKTNVIGLFIAYLDVMKKKYNNFLTYLFYSCVERISWCHVNKFVILSEICDKLENIELCTESNFISNLFNSLTNKNLCKVSTKVYLNICKKLSKDLWKKTFGEHLKNYINTWEAEKKYSTLHELCKCWIEPIIKMYRDILPFLLDHCDEKSILYQSHLLRIAKKYGITFSLKNNYDIMFLNHNEEFIRLNAFAAHCYEIGNLNNINYFNSISAIKHFLYFNATTNITYLREGIFNYFKILFSYLLKPVFIKNNLKEIFSFLEWLYEFQIYCFEIGSCYQRKIFGLQLYKISLQFLNSNNCADTVFSKDPNFKQAMKYGFILKKKMKESGKWKFTNKETVILLFKLVLDSAIDIEKISASIIINFFEPNILTDTEKINLFTVALDKCNSYKIFEINSGVYLFKILKKWFSVNEIKKINFKLQNNFERQPSTETFQSYVKFLFGEAMRQLKLVKKDILKATMQNTPFYGIVTALLVIGFSNDLKNHCITEKFIKKLIDMVENAVNYFVNALSLKSSDFEYSSSFEEMSLAINETLKKSEINYKFDELPLSCGDQIIITCIWRSLKVLCELAVKIVQSEYATDSIILRSSELIATVLLKCRYRGLIEAAGVEIGNLSRFLCKNQKHINLLEDYLKKLLDKNFLKNINLTRRGAGLTIMFHKIIVNDIRTERPLLHFAIKSLIMHLKNSLIKIKHKEASNYDEPCTMHLHFLKSLFADKQLQSQLSCYLEDICLICFEYISSQVFTIRNASLQLFGAVVSRLVGQNTGIKSADFGYGYSLNYFTTHFPQLAAYVLFSLKTYCQTFDNEYDSWQNSTNIIYIFTLLSKMFFSGVEIIDGTSIIYVKQIKNYLHLFLNNPIAHIRNLASKTFSSITALCSIESEIKKFKSQMIIINKFNQLNGYLNLLEYLYEKQNQEFQSITMKHTKIKSLSEVRKNLEILSKTNLLYNFWIRRFVLIKQKRLCYTVEAQLLRLSCNFKIVIKENYITESKKTNNIYILFEKMKPGFFEFINELMSLIANHISYTEDNNVIKKILGAKCIDFGINFLKYSSRYNRILLMTSIDFAINNFQKTHKILLEEINIYTNESIKNIFRSKFIQLQYVDISKLKVFASKLEDAFIQTIHMSELSASIYILSLRRTGTYDFFEDLISDISKEKITLINYYSYSDILRQLIARSLEILLCNFDYLNNKCKVTLLLASLIVLKDEVFLIRQSIRDSLLNNVVLTYDLSKEIIMDEVIYSVLLLHLTSQETMLGKLCGSEVMEFFEKYLLTVKQCLNTFNTEISYDEKITAYNEESKIINFIAFCMQKKNSKSIFTNDKELYNNFSFSIFENNRNLIQKMNIDSENLEDILKIKSFNYLTQKLKVIQDIYLKKNNEINYI